MEDFQSKHFSILNPKDVNTVIYEIHKTKEEYLDEYPKYTVERLEYIEELKGDQIQRTFFVNKQKKSGNSLVFFSFQNDRVIVNSGKLVHDEVRLTKKPKTYSYQAFITNKDNCEKEVLYTPNLKRGITIIDPENANEIIPVLYFDEKTNKVRGKCKLKPNKAYFAFEIKGD